MPRKTFDCQRKRQTIPRYGDVCGAEQGCHCYVTRAVTISMRGVCGTVASESALRSAGTFLSRVRAPPPAPWPNGGPESLRSLRCGLAI
ncbi:hypothetical protein PoB_003131500 [Plakobranchus ocellatus]|uniref:Uncharacterized protein n=1 Tax=Plakobranchus ocellatus TaxID=259542 RepID=A0AAV4A9G3_9GAST|nr:hypothetical protein PoB_003131500 [Plakobranchus ocellatus]